LKKLSKRCLNLFGAGILGAYGGLATGRLTKGSGFDSRQAQDVFVFPTASMQAAGLTQLRIHCVFGGLFPGVKMWRGMKPSA
jgi:hypothetical protein